MSSPYAFYSQTTKQVDRNCRKYANDQCDAEQSMDNFQLHFDTMFTLEMARIRRELNLMSRIHDEIGEQFNETLLKLSGMQNTDSGFFITIRPNDTKCNFVDFKEKIFKLVERGCFLEYALSFEQKGTTPEDLGKGFHCHIVAKMKQRSKGEVLRDVSSTFKSWIEQGLIASNCIDVCITKNPEELVKKYLVAYESDDEHKSLTKEWDTLWRQHNDLLPLYAQKLLTAS